MSCEALQGAYERAHSKYENEKNYPPNGIQYNSDAWKANNDKNLNNKSQAKAAWDACIAGGPGTTSSLTLPGTSSTNVGLIAIGAGAIAILCLLLMMKIAS